jgi:hypothetical protein
MHAYYEIDDVVLRVDHEGGAVYERVQDELGRYTSAGSDRVDAIFEIRQVERIPPPPRGAITRRYHLGDGELGYVRNGVDHLVRPDRFRLIFDVAGRHVVYECVGEGHQGVARHALKWLLIKVLEATGLTYIHGAGVRYAGRNIVFCGGQGAGKSSCLFRVRNGGGRVISDDTVFVGEGRLVPFTLKTNVKGDFSRRFGLGEVEWTYDAEPHLDLRNVPGGVDLLVFPRVRQSLRSEARPMTDAEATEVMVESYLREHVYHAVARRHEAARTRYAAIARGARCVAFLAGRDESEVRATLMGLLTGGSTV